MPTRPSGRNYPLRDKVVIVVPPFQSVERPSLGAHLVKAECQRANIEVQVLYLNLTFAAIIGFENYKSLCRSETSLFLGESLFAPPEMHDRALEHVSKHSGLAASYLFECISRFQLEVEEILTSLDARVIGSSTMFQQNNASLFVLKLVKKRNPEILTVLGGGGCSGSHAKGLNALIAKHYPGTVDYIFSGESEKVFVEFILNYFTESQRAYQPIITPESVPAMDDLPVTDYSDFFLQASQCKVSITPSTVWLPIESSRGCWWGMKSHCTFCSLSETGIVYRAKSADKTYRDIMEITHQGLSKRVIFTDSILPKEAPVELFRRLQGSGLKFYMEQKIPLKYEHAKVMANAGVVALQPGIETLSRDLLVKMKKGTHPWQNIELMRICKMLDIKVEWNFLHGIPGEQDQSYQMMVEFIPLLEHLDPPAALSEISIEKFSPYYDQAASFDIRDLRPQPAYEFCYPEYNNFDDIFTCYVGEYDHLSRRNPILFQIFQQRVDKWRESKKRKPGLVVSAIGGDNFLIKDTRESAISKWTHVNREQAQAALIHGFTNTAVQDWAVQNRFAIWIDKIYVPLATCHPDLYEQLNSIEAWK